MPAPAPCCSLTSIAFNPSNHTLYVADYATTNVYAIDTATNAVQSAVYTNGLFTNVDLGPGQNLPGSAPKTVLVNPATNRGISIDTATNAVQSAVYTNGLFTNVDLGPGQNLPGSAPKTVLVNPATNRWIY